MYKYKTKNGEELTIPNVGVTVNGFINSPVKLENPNLELVFDESAPSTGHVTGVAPQNVQPINPPALSPMQPDNQEAA